MKNLFLALVLCLALVGCGEKKEEESANLRAFKMFLEVAKEMEDREEAENPDKFHNRWTFGGAMADALCGGMDLPDDIDIDRDALSEAVNRRLGKIYAHQGHDIVRITKFAGLSSGGEMYEYDLLFRSNYGLPPKKRLPDKDDDYIIGYVGEKGNYSCGYASRIYGQNLHELNKEQLDLCLEYDLITKED